MTKSKLLPLIFLLSYFSPDNNLSKRHLCAAMSKVLVEQALKYYKVFPSESQAGKSTK